MKLGLTPALQNVGPNGDGVSVIVDPGSIADKAGILNGDIVVAINGFSPPEWFRLQNRRESRAAIEQLEVITPPGNECRTIVIPTKQGRSITPPSEGARAPLLERSLTAAERKKAEGKFRSNRERWRAQVCGDPAIESDGRLIRFLMLIAEYLYNNPGHPWHFQAFLSQDKIASSLSRRKEAVSELCERAVESGHLRFHRGTGKGNPSRYEPVIWPEGPAGPVRREEGDSEKQPTVKISREEWEAMQAALARGEQLKRERAELEADQWPHNDLEASPPAAPVCKTPWQKFVARDEDAANAVLAYMRGKWGDAEDRATEKLNELTEDELERLRGDRSIDEKLDERARQREATSYDPFATMYHPDWGR